MEDDLKKKKMEDDFKTNRICKKTSRKGGEKMTSKNKTEDEAINLIGCDIIVN
jgi:hypothetical protein